jgi:NarL family two-component system response regulator LiaR
LNSAKQRVAGGTAVEKIRVLVVDDDERYSRTLARFLDKQPDMEVVGRAADGEEAARAYSDLDPSVVLMDAYMRKVDGVEGVRRIVARHPDARVLMLTAHNGSELRLRSLDAGAAGLVAKRDAGRGLLGRIRQVAGGAERPDAHVMDDDDAATPAPGEDGC